MPDSVDTNRWAVYEALPQLAALSPAEIANTGFDMNAANMLQDVLDHNNITILHAFSQVRTGIQAHSTGPHPVSVLG